MEFGPSAIQLILNLVVGAGIIAVGIPYIRAQFKKGKVQVQDESNQLLRNLVEDQKKSIEALEDWRKDATLKIEAMQTQIAELSNKKNDLEKLIMVALVDFFKANPELAKQVDGQLKGKQ